MSGYVRAQRARFGHPLFKASKRNPFCQGYAWDWLVANAAWKEHKVSVAGKMVLIRRGQLCHSIRHLAEVWGWPKSVVDRFLGRLEGEEMIETDSGTGQTIITICNYERYQTSSEDDGDRNAGDFTTGTSEKQVIGVQSHMGTARGTAGPAASYCKDDDIRGHRDSAAVAKRDSSGTAAGQQRDNIKEGKEREEKKEARAAAPVPISQPFEVPDRTADQDRFPEFWAAYPKREGQVQAQAAFITATIKVDAAEIIAKALLYAKSRQGEDPRYTLAPAKWLTDKRWTDEYAPPKADDAASKKRAAWSRMAAGFDTPNARRSA